MDGEILLPRDALALRLKSLPQPDADEFQPTNFFRRLLESQPVPIGTTGEIQRMSLWADHQRLQHKLSDKLAAFHQHRACHGLEFAVVLALHGDTAARPYLADVGHWAHEFERLILPEWSAVPGKQGFVA